MTKKDVFIGIIIVMIFILGAALFLPKPYDKGERTSGLQNRCIREAIMAKDNTNSNETTEVSPSAEKNAMDKREKPVAPGDESLIQDENQLPKMKEGLPVLPKDKTKTA